MDNKIPIVDKSQLYYGIVTHWIIFTSFLISLIAPVFILMFPHINPLNHALLFNAIFEGLSPVEIWDAAGLPFRSGYFWKLFLSNIINPDGFAVLGVALGCSVTLWALIPVLWQFIKKKEYFYVHVSLFVMTLIALAMSGLFNIAG